MAFDKDRRFTGRLENLIVQDARSAYFEAELYARRQAQDAANQYGYAWLFRFQDEWAISVSRTPNCPVIADGAQFFQRKEKAPE